jgi:molybdopterin-guanine dinucleotide biosynthesis protein A
VSSAAKSAAAQLAGYVLAGGGSTRFGSDKALAGLDGQPMLLRMTALVEKVAGAACVVAPAERYAGLGVSIVPDRWPGAGPLGGIATALLHTAETLPGCEWNLVLGCDLPFLSVEWLSYLADYARKSGAQAVLPVSAEGPEPLCACYRTDAGPALAALLEGGVRKITAALERVRMEVLDEAHWKRFDSAGRLFLNMNTVAEYARIRAGGEENKP